MKLKFAATVKNGELLILSKRALQDHLATFEENTPLDITVSRHRKDRSGKQNRYYWGVVLELISEHTGHTPEELHEIFKRKFLPPKIIKYRDAEIRIPASTTEADTLAFTDYVERVRAEAGTMGIDIPNPDQVHF